jgi:O-antigen ligase
MPSELVLAAFGLIGLVAIVVIAGGLDASVVVSVGLALSIFSGNWGELGLPVGIDRIVIVAGIGLAILRHARTGGPWPGIRPVHVALAAVTAYAIGSAAWVGTVTDKGSAFALLDQLGVIPFLLFVTAPIVFGRSGQRMTLIVVLAVTGAYLAFTGVAETLNLRPLVFPGYINDPGIGLHYGRARGPFLESAAYGGGLITCSAVCVLAVTLFRDRLWVRWVVGAILVAAALAIVGTLTRQVWLAGVVSGAVTLAAFGHLRRYIVPVAIVGVLVTLGALTFVPGLGDRADARANDQGSVWDRTNSNRAAERMASERPVLGFGWGNFTAVGTEYYVQSPDYPVSTVAELHNVPLSFLAELGVVGLGGWALAVLLAASGSMFRRGPPEVIAWQVSMVMIGVSWLVLLNFTPFRSSFTNYAVWTWFGVVAVVVQQARRDAPGIAPAFAPAPDSVFPDTPDRRPSPDLAGGP